MWWEGILKYSKNYIPKTYEEITLIPVKLKSHVLLSSHGARLLTMYNEFKQFHYSTDDISFSTYTRELDNVFVTIEDLLRATLIEKNIEFSAIFYKKELIGFVSYKVSPGYCLYILDIWIDPEYRGKGYFSITHRFIRRIATIMECKYMDLGVLLNNKSSLAIYQKMGYLPYISTHSHVTSASDNTTSPRVVLSLFKIVTLDKFNFKQLYPDFKRMWTEYHEYKRHYLALAGLLFSAPIYLNMYSIIKERLDGNVTCQLFYHNDTIVGFFTLVKANNTNWSCTAQINDLYFTPLYLENCGTIIMEYIKYFIWSEHTDIKYYSIFSAVKDPTKKAMFQEAKMVHRADNLFLNI